MGKVFDENDAVRNMRSVLSAESNKRYGDDDLLLLLDAMFDYYEEMDDFSQEEEPSAEGAVEYVKKCLRKDKDNVIDLSEVAALVEAELKYEESLEDE